MVIQDCLNKNLQHSKDTSTDVRKIKLAIEDLKKEGVKTVNRLIKQVNSIKAGADSSHNELAVSVQTSYSNFSKDVERSYDTFCRNILNTLKYFLVRR